MHLQKINKYSDIDNYGLDERLSRRLKRKVSEDKIIRLSTFDKLMLLLHDMALWYGFTFIHKISCWKKKEELTRLFAEGKLRIEKELNIVIIVRNSKRNKVFS